MSGNENNDVTDEIDIGIIEENFKNFVLHINSTVTYVHQKNFTEKERKNFQKESLKTVNYLYLNAKENIKKCKKKYKKNSSELKILESSEENIDRYHAIILSAKEFYLHFSFELDAIQKEEDKIPWYNRIFHRFF